MASVKVELNRSGVAELLHGPEIEETLRELASGIASRCGEGYSYDTKQMGTRVIASAFTDTPEAMAQEFENNNLLRALG